MSALTAPIAHEPHSDRQAERRDPTVATNAAEDARRFVGAYFLAAS
jgi:hypothetical protein